MFKSIFEIVSLVIAIALLVLSSFPVHYYDYEIGYARVCSPKAGRVLTRVKTVIKTNDKRCDRFQRDDNILMAAGCMGIVVSGLQIIFALLFLQVCTEEKIKYCVVSLVIAVILLIAALLLVIVFASFKDEDYYGKGVSVPGHLKAFLAIMLVDAVFCIASALIIWLVG